MNIRPLRAFLLAIVWGCLISGLAQSSQAQTDDHVVTDVQGKVSVKRARRGKYVPAYIGMSVGNGDTFRLDTPGSRASVTCSDGAERPVARNPFTLQCQNTGEANKPVLPPRNNNRRVTKLRGGPETNVYPVLVSPRMTTLLNPTPLIRWLPARDATSYKVSVFQGSAVVWSTTVGNVTQVQFPNDPKVALIPGKTYRVVVYAGTHSSSEERAPNLGFAVLIPDEADKVRAAEARIRGLRLSDESTRLLVAELYANWVAPNGPDGKALNAEAIELLEGLGEMKAPALVRQLGDLYLAIGLSGKAEGLYLRALKLSQDAEDIENQALAQHALGRIFAKTKLNISEAMQRLQSARSLYQSLEDAGAVAEVDRDIREIQK